MKTNGRYLLATGIIAALLTLSGCGGDDNGSNPSDSHNGSGGGATDGQPNNGPILNKTFQYTVFDIFSEVVDEQYKSAWGKIKATWRESGVTEEISTVVGKTSYKDEINPDKNEFEYYVGKNAFVAIPERDYAKYAKFKVIDSNTYQVTQSKDNSTITSRFKVTSYDLSGKGKLSKDAKNGIITDLHYDYFPNNITFPKGSTCYLLQEIPEQSYYFFYTYAERDEISIDAWLKQEPKNTYYNNDGQSYNPQVSNVVKENIGQNNILPAVHYQDQFGQYHAAVQFNGMLYTADYYEKGVKEAINTDPKTSRVECWMYNDIAANFLEQQIKVNYK